MLVVMNVKRKREGSRCCAEQNCLYEGGEFRRQKLLATSEPSMTLHQVLGDTGKVRGVPNRLQTEPHVDLQELSAYSSIHRFSALFGQRDRFWAENIDVGFECFLF